MSYSRRQLYAMGEPIGDSATRRELGGKVIYGGGGSGGGGTTTSVGTQYTSTVPKWLEGEQKEVVARGLALAEQPYQAYGGERVSQFTPLQRQAFTGAERQQIAPQLGFASGLAALGGTQSFRDPGTAGSFMNPFIEQAIAPQLQGLARQAQIEGTRQQGEATMRGAFGGSRDAIMRAEREKNLLSQQADVLGRGYAQAFDTAQAQFNAEQARRLGAAQALGGLGQQQFGQEMDITGRQQQFGTQQQQQIQRILDQQFADFQAQRDFPYQQIGFASDLIQGRGGSTRSLYNQPGPSGLQTIAGLGTAAAGLGGLMAKGGEVKGYADGGITALLGDADLAKRQQTGSPMEQMVAAEEAQQRAMLRSAAPSEMPEMSDMTEEELLAALQSAIQQGDETKARVIAELIEERKMPESGIAQVAPESVGEVPEGGIMGMYGGGAVAFQEGGRTPYTPRMTSGQRMLDDLLQSGVGLADALAMSGAAADAQGILSVPMEAASGIASAVADTKALPMSSGYLAQRDRDEAAREARRQAARDREAGVKSPSAVAPMVAAAPTGNVATPAGGGRGIMAGPTAEDLARATRENPRMMAGLPALEKAPAADAAGNVATPGGAGGGGAMGVNQIMGIMREAGYDPKAAQADLIARQEQLASDRAAGVAADRAALDKMIAERGVYGKEQEERMKGELEGLTGKRGEAKNFALIQAGLSILSADPSRGALAAIGQGAIQGLGAYKGDIDKLEAKRDKINERTDRILDIRRQERMADDDKRLALQKEENRLKEANSRDMFELYKGFGVEDRAVATAVTQQVISSREKALDRQDRAQRLSQASKGDAAQYRMMLTSEIRALRDKRDKGVGLDETEARELAAYEAELKNLGTVLSGRIGIAGQAAPAANMTGWGKAIVE